MYVFTHPTIRQSRHTRRLKIVPPLKKQSELVDISVEVVVGIHMGGGHHLGEIDERQDLIVVYHDVELVEVTMNQSALGQAYVHLHELSEHFACVVYVCVYVCVYVSLGKTYVHLHELSDTLPVLCMYVCM
jgi:hypothetical protein